MNLFIALLGAAVVLALSSYSWRISIKVVLVVVVIEGGLRKWVLPQASEAIYFLKDGILIGAYAGYLLKDRHSVQYGARHHHAIGWMSIAATIILLQALNPALGSVLVGLIGAKSYLLYVPLVFLIGDMFRTSLEFRTFLRWYLLLCIPICLLGIAQFFASPDSPLNVYAPSLVETDAAVFGEDGNVRVTGTFPYIVGFSEYLIFCLSLISALLIHHKSRWWLLASGAELLIIPIALFMTGSRTAMLSALIVVVAFCVYSALEKDSRSRMLAIVLAAFGIIGMLGSSKFFPTAVAAFVDRVQSNDDGTDRLLSSFIEPAVAAQYSGIGGYGTGSEQVAGFALRDALNLGPASTPAPMAESELTRVMLELGVLGFIAWYGLRIYFAWALWSVSRKVRDPMLRHLALGAFLFHALLFTGQLVTNTTVGVFYWFLAGFAFLLPRLDVQSTAYRRNRLRRLPAAEIRRPALAVST